MVAPVTFVAVSIFTRSTVFLEVLLALSCMTLNTVIAHWVLAQCFRSTRHASGSGDASTCSVEGPMECDGGSVDNGDRNTNSTSNSNDGTSAVASASTNTSHGGSGRANTIDTAAGASADASSRANDNTGGTNNAGIVDAGFADANDNCATSADKISEARMAEKLCERELPMLLCAGFLGGMTNIIPWVIMVTLIPTCVQDTYNFLASNEVVLVTSNWHSLPAMVISFFTAIWLSYDSFYVAANIPSADVVWIACVVYFDLFFLSIFTAFFIVIFVALYVLADDGAEAYPGDSVGAVVRAEVPVVQAAEIVEAVGQDAV